MTVKNKLTLEVSSAVKDLCGSVDYEILHNEISRIFKNYEISEVSSSPFVSDLPEKIKLFLSAKQLEGLSPSTIKGYKLDLKIFSERTNKSVTDITTADIRIYLGEFSHLKLSSVSKKLSVLKSFFGWLTVEEIIIKDPTAKIKTPKREKRPPKALSIEELEMLRENCNTLRQRAILEFLYSTGCRLSEITELDIEDIDFSEMGARVLGKGNKVRDVFLSHKAIYHLKKYLDSRHEGDPALFVTERFPNSRMGGRAVQREINKIAEQAELGKQISPHCIRHTFATLTLNNGAELAAVQSLLGHSSPNTTLIYAQLSDERKKENHKRFLVM